ncbi:MAG: hypothetical protein P0Y52_07970 [Candidatus Brevundimonas phytovorans]|nr:hypothetical protein [Brevundimonas sp.]WEK56495.1 MAG: hypothetical protein P0Y52_07970 [Brevundimonas sp.]
MSAGHHIGMPFASWEGIVALLTALGLGGVLTAWAQRPSRRAVAATAAKDEATGEAAVIAAIASALTGTTASLREEIERMQDTLNEFRQRVAEAEAEVRAAVAREAEQARLVADLRRQLEISHADVVRLRAERDTATEKTIQQEGEIRQLKAVIDAHARATA